MQEYILAGGNPVREVYDAVWKTKMAFFFSYRMNHWYFVELDERERYPTLDRFYMEHAEYWINCSNNENPVGRISKTVVSKTILSQMCGGIILRCSPNWQRSTPLTDWNWI